MFIPKRFRIPIYIFSFGVLISCSQKSKDYNTIFGDRYLEAANYFQKNTWILDTLIRYGVDPDLAISVVFPEVIRYSALKDIAETHSLEVLYAQYGSKYADFSIGIFQMKPSFAYHLEKDWNSYTKKDKYKTYLKPFDTLSNPSNRLQRIYRLKDPNWQIKYLVIFCDIIEIRFEKEWVNENQKVKFFASAYNVGYWQKIEEIKRKGVENYYHLGLLKPKKCFNYSEISLQYYQKNQMPK